MIFLKNIIVKWINLDSSLNSDNPYELDGAT